jgi:hypothetical protein
LSDLTEPTPEQRTFDLSPEEAIVAMNDILEKMRGETDREQLKDIDADTAFELGYETALFDYKHLTSPDPREVGVIVYTKPEETNDEAE